MDLERYPPREGFEGEFGRRSGALWIYTGMIFRIRPLIDPYSNVSNKRLMWGKCKRVVSPPASFRHRLTAVPLPSASGWRDHPPQGSFTL